MHDKTVEMDSHEPGLGFNPMYLNAQFDWPNPCSYLEAGTSVVMQQNLFTGLRAVCPNISLHLSRVPMCEPDAVQDAFLDGLFASLPDGVHSIGVHLCGPYSEDLGRFGLSTMFRLTSRNKERAERFLRRAQALADGFGCGLLIENANFYEESAESTLAGIAYAGYLSETIGVGLILDVAHLVMACHNVGLDPVFALGRYPLRFVEVVHLSGIKKDRLGVLHDGHNLSVDETVWSLASLALRQIKEPAYVVLEHTDPCWAAKKDVFDSDYSKLRALLGGVRQELPRPPIVSLEDAAIGYMANIVLPMRCKTLFDSMPVTKFQSLVRRWAYEFLVREKEQATTPYVILRKNDWFEATKETLDPVADFEKWVENAA